MEIQNKLEDILTHEENFFFKKIRKTIKKKTKDRKITAGDIKKGKYFNDFYSIIKTQMDINNKYFELHKNKNYSDKIILTMITIYSLSSMFIKYFHNAKKKEINEANYLFDYFKRELSELIKNKRLNYFHGRLLLFQYEKKQDVKIKNKVKTYLRYAKK